TSSRDSGPPNPTKKTALSLTEQPPEIVDFLSYVERAELPEAGADLVEAHLVDELLELEGVVGEEGHPPFPVVEAHGAGDYLGHLAGVLATGPAVLPHEAGPLLRRQRVPVVGEVPLLAHRVEADVTAVFGDLGAEASLDVGARFDVLCRSLGCVVAADLDHRQVRVGTGGHRPEEGAVELLLEAGELADLGPEVEQQQVGLVADHCVGDAASFRGVVDAGIGVEQVAGFGQRLLLGLWRGRSPGGLVETSEVVEGEPALESLGGAQADAPFVAAGEERSEPTTVSAMAATLSTGVVGRIPWPRLNT